MTTQNFYNGFHKSARPQYKVVDERNFTYSIILKQLKEIIKNKGLIDILDFGCGVGTVSFFLASRGHNVTGIDISSLAIMTATESSKVNGLSMLTEFYDVRTGKKKISKKKFDLILCTEVLEHIQDEISTVRFLSRHLRKHGRILISVPSLNAPLYKMGLLGEFDKKVGHLRRYNLNTICEVVRKCGLIVLKSKKTEGIFRNVVFTRFPFTMLVRFIKWPISSLLMTIDSMTVPVLGESDIFILAQKV